MSESNTYENTAQRAVGGLVHCHDNIICIQFPLLHTRHSVRDIQFGTFKFVPPPFLGQK